MKDKSDRRNNPHQRKYDLQLGVRLYPWISLGMPLRSTLINPGSCCTEFRTWKSVADIHVSPTTCPNKPDHLLIIHPVPPRGSHLKWNVWRNSRVPFAINCNHLENSFYFSDASDNTTFAHKTNNWTPFSHGQSVKRGQKTYSRCTKHFFFFFTNSCDPVMSVSVLFCESSFHGLRQNLPPSSKIVTNNHLWMPK